MLKNFLMLIIFVAPIFGDVPDQKLHKECLYPTVMVFCRDPGQIGTGVIVRSEKVKNKYLNVVITCAHCTLSNNCEINVFKYKNWSELDSVKDYKAVILTNNIQKELAILFFVSDKQMPTVELGMDEKCYIGNKVHLLGCGIGENPRLSEGKITEINHKITHSLICFRHSAYTVIGDSGGGLFNNENKVIGLVHSIRANPQNIDEKFHEFSCAVKISTLKEWDKEMNGGLKFVYDKKEKLPDLPK